jgi:hypothetical protein
MDEYCPDCVVKLKKDKKKLGSLSVWLVCPKCGFRKREDSDYCVNKEMDYYKRQVKQQNLDLFDEENYINN